MTSPFNTPILRPADHLNEMQRARAAALLVASEARPRSSAMDLLHLADYVFQGRILSTEPRNPYHLFGSQQMDLDPERPTPHLDMLMDNTRVPNFGDLDNEAGLRGELAEDDGLG